MIKILSTTVLLGGILHLNAISSQEIDTIEQNVNRLDTIVQKNYSLIKANSGESILDILKKYPSDISTLIQKWFHIVYNQTSNTQFALETRTKIKLYLDQILLADENAISEKDYQTIAQKLNYIKTDESLNAVKDSFYVKTTNNVNLRNLPIFLPLTKISVVKNSTSLKILYTVTYTTEQNETSKWGYVIGANQGWINLKNSVVETK